MDINTIFSKVDDYFKKNQPKEAEKLLKETLAQAKEENNTEISLQILNELIGYYRQTSEVDQLLTVIENALNLADKMGLNGTIPYATTALNAATGYRAIGRLEQSLKCFQTVEDIYLKQLAPQDNLLAGFYNNYSLLLQEMGEYSRARECLLKALSIAEHNQSKFKIAVTYANLANTAVLERDFENAENYARTSIKCFEDRNLFDPHYCAALSALSMCHYEKGEYQEAMEICQRGMTMIEQKLGKNLQYERLKKNWEMCKIAMESQGEVKEKITGMDICRKYYETYGKKMIQEKFPDYVSKIAVGLVGEGSECFGFDDENSRDHDWGPGFYLWVTEDTYHEIGESLEKCYEELPKEFMGFQRKVTSQGAHRCGVVSISAFYERLVGAKTYEEIDWRMVEDASLAAASNGQVFVDEEGIFSEFRNKLKQGYPKRILYLKLAEDVAKISQTGQYNFMRMLKRGDRLTADGMLMECIRHMMRLQHHMNNVYPPHEKWLSKSTSSLPNGQDFVFSLKKIHSTLKEEDEKAMVNVEAQTEALCGDSAATLYQMGYISDVESYLDVHVQELLFKSEYVELEDEELVDRIARLEFRAFDKVKNEGGRAYCQNDWPTFSIMRKSQYLTWNHEMLCQYLYDFSREYERGHNLITEKYGRMMESTEPEKYKEMAQYFSPLSEQKKAVIEQIVAVQMNMMEEFAKDYPQVAKNARSLHTYEDDIIHTSYETYLRGEISTYSDKMLQLYGAYVVQSVSEGKNIARAIIENTAKLYGYDDLEKLQ